MADYKKVTLKNGQIRYRKTISLGFYPDGRRKQKQITAKTVKELRKLESEYMLGEKKVSSKTSRTFGDLYDLYLDEQSKTLQPTTIYHKQCTKKIFKPFLDRSITSIKDSEIKDFFEGLCNETTVNTVNHYYSVMHAFYKWLYINHIITNNPMDFVKQPRQNDHKEMNYLTEDEFWKLYKFVDDDKMKLFLMVLFYTGIRKGEACALSKKELVDHELHLFENCQPINGSGRIVTDHMKTKSSNRIVPIPLWLEGDLSSMLEESEYPFLNQYVHIGRKLHRALKKAGLKDIRVHDLRHSYAALLISRGVDIYTVSKLMGHTSVAITSGIYGHLYDKKRKAVADLLVKK